MKKFPVILFSQDDLVDLLYNIDRSPGNNVIQVYITRLRKLLGKSKIKTLRGQGYFFDPDEP